MGKSSVKLFCHSSAAKESKLKELNVQENKHQVKEVVPLVLNGRNLPCVSSSLKYDE